MGNSIFFLISEIWDKFPKKKSSSVNTDKQVTFLELSRKTSIKTFLIGESLLKDLDNNSIFSVL